MQRVLLTSIVSIALVLAIVVASPAGSPTFLYGKIATETGAPVKNQPVVIEGHAVWGNKWPWIAYFNEPTTKELRVHAVTDEQGAFQILNLPPGVYTIKATRLGGEPVPIVQDFHWDGNTKEITGNVSTEKLLPVAGGTTTNTIEK
jgi:hypothetical protein